MRELQLLSGYERYLGTRPVCSPETPPRLFIKDVVAARGQLRTFEAWELYHSNEPLDTIDGPTAQQPVS